MTTRTSSLIFLLLAGTAIAAPAFSQIYAGDGEAGALVLSNFRSDDTPTLVVPPTENAQQAVTTRLPRARASTAKTAFHRIVAEVAQKHDVDPQLLHAIIKVESNYNPGAVSQKGACGLMQLMPATARRFGVRDVFDPRENIAGGARYLKWLLTFFHDDVRLALAAYNAGEQTVVRSGYRIPANPETQNFVPKVLGYYAGGSNG